MKKEDELKKIDADLEHEIDCLNNLRKICPQ